MGTIAFKSRHINYCLNESVPRVIYQAGLQLLDSLVFGPFDSCVGATPLPSAERIQNGNGPFLISFVFWHILKRCEMTLIMQRELLLCRTDAVRHTKRLPPPVILDRLKKIGFGTILVLVFKMQMKFKKRKENEAGHLQSASSLLPWGEGRLPR